MTTASTGEYQTNRAKLTLSELSKYDGMWVAFSSNGQRVVAYAPTIEELFDRLQATGENLRDVVLERIEIDSTEIYIGAAELS